MAAKNKRRITGSDPHSDLLRHMEAYRHAQRWAQKCLDLRAAGKPKEALQCESKARNWLARALEIERRAGVKG